MLLDTMFGVAGLNVAMGDAPDLVKSHASDITATCAADGVALALRRHVLLRPPNDSRTPPDEKNC